MNDHVSPSDPLNHDNFQNLALKILDPNTRENPYPIYSKIRECEPVWLLDGLTVMFGSFHICETILHHPNASNDRHNSVLFNRYGKNGVDAGTPIPELTSFLFLDPPAHTRIRRLVSRVFTYKTIRHLEQWIGNFTDELLDSVAKQGQMDIMSDFAHRLPVSVICKMFGIEVQDQEWLLQRTSLLSIALDPFLAIYGVQPPGIAQRIVAERELNEYFRKMIAIRRSSPREDLLSALTKAEDSGTHLTEDEIATTCRFFFNAGHETTVNLIANCILAILRNPKELELLQKDPSQIPRVVEETLRYDPPVQLVHRYAADEIEVSGTRIARGTTLLLLIAAAHRDPLVTRNPDLFDSTRPDIRHLAFGLGPHYCLGASLARLEGAVALDKFIRRVEFPRLLENTHLYKPQVALRGLKTLPLAFKNIKKRGS